MILQGLKPAAAALAVDALRLPATQSVACTGIRLVAEDGSPAFGRTMALGADVVAFDLVAVPRGATFRRDTRDGGTGTEWEADDGFAAATPREFIALVEGAIKAGLQAGAVFFMPFEKARCHDFDPAKAGGSISG